MTPEEMPFDPETIHLGNMKDELPFWFLQKITRDFDEQRKIGEPGTFGNVYKGILNRDGQALAVKKHQQTGRKTPDYTTHCKKVQQLMKYEHVNIAKIRAFCLTDHASLFCYDFYSKGGLHNHIFDKSPKSEIRPVSLNWDARAKIIKGICKGLESLHKEHILHLNLKPQNILLDPQNTAKITDFMYTKILDKDDFEKTASGDVGSCGYHAPEYIQGNRNSAKTDIYALGVIILEITTGKKNIACEKPEAGKRSAHDYLQEINKRWREENVRMETITSHYEGLGPAENEEIALCIEIGLKCVEVNPAKRPELKDIMIDLDISSKEK